MDGGSRPKVLAISNRSFCRWKDEGHCRQLPRKARQACRYVVAEYVAAQTLLIPVITVPAYFNDSQRQATKDGERLVGQPARRQAVVNGENTIFASKR